MPLRLRGNVCSNFCKLNDDQKYHPKSRFCKPMHLSPLDDTHENWMHSPLCRVRCCSGLKPILNGIRMHVVSFPQLLKTITMLLLYAEGTFWAFVAKFGPTSCMGVLSNGHTAVTQNHITTSFDVQPKTQASGYNTYNSCLSVKPLNFPSCNFSSNIFLLSVRLLFYFVYPQLTVFSLSNRTTARLARLNFCCLQLVGQLIGELSHDVVHPDVPFFLWSVDQEDHQFPVPGVRGFLYDLQLGHKCFFLHVVPENDGSFLWPLPRLQSCKRDRSS